MDEIRLEGRNSLKNQRSEEADRQWRLISEAIRRDIRAKSTIRRALIPFVQRPLSENIPSDALKVMERNSSFVAKLGVRYRAGLTEYLNLPPVPDELLVPDLRNAFGITLAEQALVATRYRFARDIKLLSLAAEILEQGGVKLNRKNETVLPSGTIIAIDSCLKGEDVKGFLDPLQWERRKQIKDRVYEIAIGNRPYILKEKKTARHMDTKEDGHIPGLSAAQEFATAQHFLKKGFRNHGDIRLSWEQPLGFVIFPDGFQFTAYEFKEGLISDDDIEARLVTTIMNRRDFFEREFRLIAEGAEKWKTTPGALRYLVEGSGSSLAEEELKPLNFDDFTKVKIRRMVERAKDLQQETIYSLNFTNSDADGHAFRIRSTPNVELEIVGMDFEYFLPITPKRTKEDLGRLRRSNRNYSLEHGIGYGPWKDGSPVKRIQQAAYLAMLELEETED